MAAVRTTYFLRIPNVGDRVNAVVIEAVAERPVLWVADQLAPHVLAIGSMMVSATPRSIVWGTGVMHPEIGVGQPDAENVYALRGPLTHSALRGAGIAVKDVPFGDPGYAAPRLLGIQRAAAVRSTIGLVAHYVDRRDPNIERMAKEEGVVLLDVHAAPDAFLRAMAECSAVLSSSLHGLVFAEALGIPNLWIRAGDGIAGGDFKFRDCSRRRAGRKPLRTPSPRPTRPSIWRGGPSRTRARSTWMRCSRHFRVSGSRNAPGRRRRASGPRGTAGGVRFRCS